MAKRIANKTKLDMMEEYVNSNITYAELAVKYNVGQRSVEEMARINCWVDLRKSARQKALHAAKENLDTKLSESVVLWDTDVLDHCNDIRLRLKDILENEPGLTITQLQRLSESMSKINQIQRQITERDIKKIQTVNQDQVEYLRKLILGE